MTDEEMQASFMNGAAVSMRGDDSDRKGYIVSMFRKLRTGDRPGYATGEWRCVVQIQKTGFLHVRLPKDLENVIQ